MSTFDPFKPQTPDQQVEELLAHHAPLRVGQVIFRPGHGFWMVVGSNDDTVKVCRCQLDNDGNIVSVDGRCAESVPVNELCMNLKPLAPKPQIVRDPTATKKPPKGAAQSYKNGWSFPTPRRSRWTGHAGGPGKKRVITYREDWLSANDTSLSAESHDCTAGEIRRDLSAQEFCDPVQRDTGSMQEERKLKTSPTAGRRVMPEVGDKLLQSMQEREQQGLVENVEIIPGVRFTGDLASLINTEPWSPTPAERRRHIQNQSKKQREHTKLLTTALNLYFDGAGMSRDRVAKIMGLARSTVREMFTEIANLIGEHILNVRTGAEDVGCRKESEDASNQHKY
jgi:hypothetical protein